MAGRHHRAMENNDYALEILTAERLSEARQAAHRRDLLALARARRRPLRARLGAALIVLGEWLRRDGRPVPQPA
jgi:hypothetical protein